MNYTEFNDERNLRCVAVCCASCAHGCDTHSICVTCLHPDRDGPVAMLPYQVCDGWKKTTR